MKKLVVLPLLVLFVSIPCKAPVRAVSAPALIEVLQSPKPLLALDLYKEVLRSRGQKLEDQGVLIESLDGRQCFAEHNPGITFNPASVMKLATSLAALSTLGPDYRYRTNFRADGAVEVGARRLTGDLVVEGGANPMFSAEDAQQVGSQLARLGISVVTGGLRVCGPFYYFATGYHLNLSRETSAAKLRLALQRAGIRIQGGTSFGESAGAILLSHYSDQLVRILLYQNAHSSNAIAEVVGESVGGPKAIQDFLVGKIGLLDSEVYVGRASGLEFNRITPRAALKVLRALIANLAERGLKPDDVMPLAGVDSGTLRGRLSGQEVRGAVVAKTGTLNSLDNGVSTLVGVAYTRMLGPVLFAVLNSGGSVHTYRRLQDQFIAQLLQEEGGPAPLRRSEDALAEMAHDSIVQVLYNPKTVHPADSSAD